MNREKASAMQGSLEATHVAHSNPRKDFYTLPTQPTGPTTKPGLPIQQLVDLVIFTTRK